MRCEGKIVLVTGAQRGIGRAVALRFAQEGADVALNFLDDTGAAESAAAQIAALGRRCFPIAADVSKPDDARRLIEEAERGLGPIDVLVNNAAVTVPGRPPAPGAVSAPERPRPTPVSTTPDSPFGPGSFLHFPLKGFRVHFEVGLFASYRLMQLVLPDMIAARRGAIVNISSLAGFIPGEGPYERSGRPGPIAYGGNKAALHHLTQCVAVEMAPYGIAVNVLSPSEPVITPGNLVAAVGETSWASPEEFAEATVRVALADPATTTGQLLWSDDVLHPERGRRDWLR